MRIPNVDGKRFAIDWRLGGWGAGDGRIITRKAEIYRTESGKVMGTVPIEFSTHAPRLDKLCATIESLSGRDRENALRTLSGMGLLGMLED